MCCGWGPSKVEFAFKHCSSDVFLYYPAPDAPDLPPRVNGADGKAAEMLLVDFAGIGQDRLKRVKP